MMDQEFKHQKPQVCLILDNFSGHSILYKPKFIKLVPFKPNMTLFVQPLNASIIRCFKAHYCRTFCQRAIEMDDTGESDIYKIDLLEVMLMAQAAWAAMSADTIQNCWNHMGHVGTGTVWDFGTPQYTTYPYCSVWVCTD
jgi:hypothetical protein